MVNMKMCISLMRIVKSSVISVKKGVLSSYVKLISCSLDVAAGVG